jgi:hypothetical protein
MSIGHQFMFQANGNTTLRATIPTDNLSFMNFPGMSSLPYSQENLSSGFSSGSHNGSKTDFSNQILPIDLLPHRQHSDSEVSMNIWDYPVSECSDNAHDHINADFNPINIESKYSMQSFSHSISPTSSFDREDKENATLNIRSVLGNVLDDIDPLSIEELDRLPETDMPVNNSANLWRHNYLSDLQNFSDSGFQSPANIYSNSPSCSSTFINANVQDKCQSPFNPMASNSPHSFQKQDLCRELYETKKKLYEINLRLINTRHERDKAKALADLFLSQNLVNTSYGS